MTGREREAFLASLPPDATPLDRIGYIANELSEAYPDGVEAGARAGFDAQLCHALAPLLEEAHAELAAATPSVDGEAIEKLKAELEDASCSDQDLGARAVAAIERLQIAALRTQGGTGEVEPCSTCGGSPHPSGGVCVCGGVGTMLAEVSGLRQALYAARARTGEPSGEREALTDMLGALHKVFAVLNEYAARPHGDGIEAHNPHGVIGQVYADLAAHFAPFRAYVTSLAPATEPSGERMGVAWAEKYAAIEDEHGQPFVPLRTAAPTEAGGEPSGGREEAPDRFKEGWDKHRAMQLICAPVTYAALYPWLVEIGRDHGYAIALHGSLRKDMDVIAIPWTDGVTTPEALVAAVCESVGCEILGEATDKPHGRKVWTLLLTRGGYFIDFGVLASLTPATGRAESEGKERRKPRRHRNSSGRQCRWCNTYDGCKDSPVVGGGHDFTTEEERNTPSCNARPDSGGTE